MKRKKEMITRLVGKLAYQAEKCFTSIQSSQPEMVIFHSKRRSSALYVQHEYRIFLIIVGIDDGDEAISSYVREEDDYEDVQYRVLDTDRLAFEASETDTTGITVAAADRLKVNSVVDNDKNVAGTIYNYVK